jgi:maltooligosyltrehalose trehalohydrolase
MTTSPPLSRPPPAWTLVTGGRRGSAPSPSKAAGSAFGCGRLDARELTLTLETGAAAGTRLMPRDEDGVHDLIVDGVRPGDRYHYRIDGGDPRPDPASRFQPDGVHGPSEVIDPSAFRWQQDRWRGRAVTDLVIYELHVGTFSPEGTFDGTRARLRALRDLGVTAIELMPVADFAGERNWGYDGVCLFAPSRAYGRPDDLRRLVDEAHGLGLSVLLDVVYNHLGPEGAYLPEFNPGYFTDRHETPWGRGINVDGPGARMVRRFIVENAVHWIQEYRVDGLRLDATHAIIDDSPVHIVTELAAAARAAAAHPIVVHAEDHRNLAAMVEPVASGGWGLDAVWADDFHHVVRRLLAGDAHGYYADFAGTTAELARTLDRGLAVHRAAVAEHGRAPWHDPARHLPMLRSVICIQNHDQIGNRATGDRLHHAIPPERWRAASALLLTAPMTPLLFMGQEWAASAPFQYFTDLEPGLGRLVTEGRRREFAGFPEFNDPAARERIPDPQARDTFERSRLDWSERSAPGHAEVLALYTRLLALRLEFPALGASVETRARAIAADDDTVVLERGEGFWISRAAAGRRHGGSRPRRRRTFRARRLGVILTTEEPQFAPDRHAPSIAWHPEGPAITFLRAGAIIVRRR